MVMATGSVGGARAETVAELRKRIAAMPGGRVPEPVGGVTVFPPESPPSSPGDGGEARHPSVAPHRVPRVSGVPVPADIGRLLPGGVLPAGRVTALAGGAGLQVGVLARATAAGARCAVVGGSGLGLAAVAEQGGRLDCLALIPDPGPDPVSVVSVLLDGLDLVLVDPSIRSVTPARARVLAGRVRAAGVVLLVGPQWPGAELTLRSRVCRYGGLGRGTGRLETISATVRGVGRAVPPSSTEWSVGGRRDGRDRQIAVSASSAGATG